jgi:nucleoside-triphosphatase THEP1
MKYELSEKWIKAAIAGTIWAASEIVLGSFLHNLRIPFSGNILTGIGVIILVSISYTWTERGLFWRAGLICAIMKTMSPSAVIFGPMIAICAEALLLELSVRLLGRTYAGFIIGAMLAMSWNLFHKIISYIISYGSNIVEVYTRLLNMAQKQLNIQTDIVWMPIIILLIIYALFGLFTAVVGIMVGRKMLTQQPIITQPIPENTKPNTVISPKNEFNYSMLWLLVDILLIVGSFILLNLTSWIIWSATVTGIIILWSFRYNNSLRRISKPKFWIFFVFITLIAAFVFSGSQTGEKTIRDGLLTGIQMNFRAALIIVGFSVLGTELYNPKIRDFFSRTSFKHLPLALELSVESLPDFIASIPDFRTLVKNPVSVFYNVISHANGRLSEIKKQRSKKRIFIISGSKCEGKTTFTKRITDEMKKNNIPVGGILAERVIENSVTTGYDLVDIATGRKQIFLREGEEKWAEKIGKFSINPEGLKFGASILDPENMRSKKLVVIDEVGMLELSDKGWSDCLNKLINAAENNILLTIRDIYAEEAVTKWGLTDPVIFKVSENDFMNVSRLILEHIGF